MTPDDRRDETLSTDFLMGQNSANISLLMAGHAKMEEDIRCIRSDIASIRALLAEQKGERRGVMWVASGISALVAALLATFGKAILGMR